MIFSKKSLEFDVIKTKITKYILSKSAEKIIKSLEPSTSILTVKSMLNETDSMLNLIVKYGKLPLMENYDISVIKDFRDIERSFTIDELLDIRLFLVMEKTILNYIKHIKDTSNLINLNYLSNLNFHNKLFDDFNLVFNNYGEINDNATANLFTIRKSIYNSNKKLNDKMQQLLDVNKDYLSEKVIVNRNNRLCLAVKESYKNKIKGVVHDISASGQTYFIEPEAALKITAEIEINKLNEEKEIIKILSSLTNHVVENIETLKMNLVIFINLDVLSSKALYALSIDGVKPKLNDTQDIILINAKHPLLEQKNAIPISLTLNNKANMLLITGPNTGGKTVALKTVGLLTLMIQSGMLVPTSPDSSFNVFEKIYADIGDEQSIENSLSTFSSHMSKIVKMLNEYTDNSLILLDELGSGTDPNEGVALAIAIIEEFRKKEIKLIVTSHYSELKNYAYENEGIITASVAFDKETLKPLYYLKHGISGESHARLIASRLGVKSDVIKRADELFTNRQTDLAKIMSKLNDERTALDLKQEKLNGEIKKYELSKIKYDDAYEKLLKNQEQMLNKITKQEQEKWEKSVNEIKALIKKLEESKQLKTHELAEIKGSLANAPKSITIKNEEIINVGDQVLIKSYQQYGEVVSIKDSKYRVIFGLFDLEFSKDDLRLEKVKEKNKTTKKRIKKTHSQDQVTKSGDMRVDLRGFRYEEVKEELDRQIDNALLSNLKSLTIIHGFGTGAVRNAVYEYIKASKYIKSHRFGREGEGLNGVTIIELK